MLFTKKIGFTITCLFFTLSILWLEGVRIIFCGGTDSLNLILLFSVSIGLGAAFIPSVLPFEFLRRLFSIILIISLSVLYITEILLFRSFGYYYPPETVFGMADDVAGSYGGTVLSTLKAGTAPLILCLIPPVIFFIPSKNLSFKPKIFLGRAMLLLAVLLTHFSARNTLNNISKTQSFPTDTESYYSDFEFSRGVERFGLCTSVRLNALYSLIKPSFSDGTPIFPSEDISNGKAEYNISDIKLSELYRDSDDAELRELASAFLTETATEKNKYTGMFNGKNIIFICAEALSPYVINEELTPTLYKLSNEGFSFKNYYQPSFGESTLGGEYALLCSQVPGRSVGEKGLSMQLACADNLKYSLPGLFSDSGYDCFGFHNNSFSYYSRDKTHPRLGLNWYGIGGCVTDSEHGDFCLDGLISNGWPRSDNELIMSTFDILKDTDKPFFAYYLTVSGHNNYSFSENTQARKNRQTAEKLNYSEQVQAYIACQLELEKALSSLISLLDEAGILKDTVIALSNDHYPYGLAASWQGNGGRDLLSELAGRKLDRYEREKGVCFIWSAETEGSVNIEKPTSGLDVMPTVLNLFGIEFDSRVLAGRDALSSTDGLVFFSDYSFISDKACYFAEKSNYIPNVEASSDEITAVSKTVKARVKNSRKLRSKCLFKKLKNG